MNETTQILKTLGRRIAQLRKQKGMSQEDFADISGKMINTISNIERGLSDPKVTTLMSISKALGISIDELFSETKQVQTTEELPSNIATILQILKKQDDKTLKVIQKQIEAKNYENYNLLEFLTKLSTLPFYGEDGLKDRTGLMEYRYDGVN